MPCAATSKPVRASPEATSGITLRRGPSRRHERNSLAADGEGMREEFKRDVNDDKLVEAVVCLANGDGGTLLLGVEDEWLDWVAS